MNHRTLSVSVKTDSSEELDRALRKVFRDTAHPNRYSLSSRDKFKTNQDGSMVCTFRRSLPERTRNPTGCPVRTVSSY